jgi:hypothetical protein
MPSIEKVKEVIEATKAELEFYMEQKLEDDRKKDSGRRRRN